MPNLVGTGLNQVPTNGMLGGLAYQSPDHASIKDLDLKNLSQINSEIADTARDIFIYDTSKDSDGGAWRHRTSHTSWYNETLNTSVRGSRREFPAVAVIVGNSGNITIYDGDDPDLPMWMVFNTKENAYDTNYMIWGTYNFYMKNGWLYTGSPSGESWENVITRVNFISERSDLLTASGIWYGKKSIADRNTANLPGATNSSYDTQALHINSNGVNSIVATILPNAPVDSTTGLPNPTFAIATNAGITVFADDGNTYDSGDTLNWNFVDISEAKGRKVLNYGFSTGSTVRHKYLDSIRSDWGANASDVDYEDYPNLTVSVAAANDVYASQTRGIAIYSRWNNPGSINANYDDLVSFATTSYNTGWMHSDIKGAFLSDTDTTNVTGTELLTNGEFTSNVSGWSDGSGSGSSFSWSSDGGGSILFDGGAAYANAYQAITTVVGNDYTVISEEWVSGGGGSTGVYIGAGNTPPSGGTSNFYASASTVNQSMPIQFTFTATSTTTYITIGSGWSNVRIGRISMRAGVYDRSVNNKGLQVFGTVTKSAVATGAELVAYSGFSASNYLLQPYNSSMEFGTGDFYMMAWIKNTDSTSNQKIITRDLNSTNRLQFYSSGTKIQIYTDDAGSISYLNSTSDFTSGEWICVICGRKSNTLQMYVNGKFESGTGSNTNIARDVSFGAGTEVEIGRSNTGTTNYWRGSIALARIGIGFPSAEQIKKIYEDEKALFQDNAACTLYGSSDAVTALAYDDSTNLLYAGTSSGRSDFQGLRRINNTTTAVTTAMSASNGLVAEQ